MIYFILYLFIVFIVFFFMFKKHYQNLTDRLDSYDDVWLKYKEGWMITFVPIFWILSIPLIILWNILEIIYEKLTNNNNNDNSHEKNS